MFKAYYGTCYKCEPNITRLIVVKKGLCKFHNEEEKNSHKKIKPPHPKVNIKKVNYGRCIQCESNDVKLLATKYLCKYHNELKKKADKSNRIIKLVNKAEKKKSIKWLIKELDRIFSLYIRYRGSKDGINTCFTCNKPFPIKELQDGHYESRRHKSLKYHEYNNHPQCYHCNITLKGNYTVYALKMIDKYGKEFVDMLSVMKHNTVKWTAFEYQLMIKEYTDKLNKLLSI